MNLRKWFNEAWPFPERRARLAAEYQTLRGLDHALADIGLRGSLWDSAPRGLNAYDAGVFEGRRQMALEIFRVVEADPRLAFATIERKPIPGAKG